MCGLGLSGVQACVSLKLCLGSPVECGLPVAVVAVAAKVAISVDPLESTPLSEGPSTMLVSGGYSPWRNKKDASGIAPFLNQKEKFICFVP